MASRNPPLPTSSLNIIYQNTNGWTTNGDTLKRQLSTCNPDIILIEYTRLLTEDTLKWRPYISYQVNKYREKKPAGAAILIKPNIEHKRIDQEKIHHDTVAIQIMTTTGPIIMRRIESRSCSWCPEQTKAHHQPIKSIVK